MSRKTDVSALTKAEAVAIGKAGGPTFRPLARNKYRLNQLNRFGPLTQRQCNTIRAIVGLYLSDIFPEPPIVYPLLEAVMDGNGQVICPICKCINRHALPGVTVCEWQHCLRRFVVKAGLLPSALIRDGGFTFCPRCHSPNLLGKSGPGLRKCVSCDKPFLAVRRIESLPGKRRASA